MTKHTLALATGALLMGGQALAFGEADPALDLEQCNTSSMFGEYIAPKELVAAPTEFKKGVDAASLAAEHAALHQWLSASKPALGQMKAFSVELTRSDRIAIGAEQCDNCWELQTDTRRYQVGVVKNLNVNIDFNHPDVLTRPKAEARDFAGGRISTGPDGELVWTALFHSPEATGMRIGFEEFKLPAGAEMYVYTEHGEAFGPYVEWGPNDNGNFWTNTVVGETATLQLHFYGATSPEGLADLNFEITDVTHMGPRLRLGNYVKPEALGDKAFCSWNASCVENNSCTSHNAVNAAENAVAEMIYNSGGGAYICSGGLLADTDTGSLIPYFLTANHCISKGREANSLEAVFDFSVSCGTTNCPRYGDGFNVRTNGSSIVSSNRTSDYTLLQLAQTPGGSRAYLGWNNSPVAFTNNAALYRVSHPGGSPLAFSHHVVDTNKGTCSSWPRGNWIYSRDITGATEGGSSGSPVVNSAGEVVGQLSGGCGTNVNDNCDAENNATVDGAFAAYWDQVAGFLDPDGGSGEPPGQCDLLPSGSSCTSNSQCCSDNCKGKPGNRTCK